MTTELELTVVYSSSGWALGCGGKVASTSPNACTRLVADVVVYASNLHLGSDGEACVRW